MKIEINLRCASAPLRDPILLSFCGIKRHVLPNGMLMHNGSNGSWLAIAMFDRQKDIVAGFVGNDAAAMGKQSEIIRSLVAAAVVED